MRNIKVNLHPFITNINLPTVIKTAVFPGDSVERLFVATQVGEIFYTGNENLETFLDIRSQILELGTLSGGYDERGLLGLAFHPYFHLNGRFYLHYSLAGSQGPGALAGSFRPNPCDPNTLNLQWEDRESRYDHIDTVEEWILDSNLQPQKRRTLLNLRRPFANHNGVNSLKFSPETERLLLTTGDGGSGFDPFNLSQNTMEICGKILEIDVDQDLFLEDPPVVSRFDQLPMAIQETLTVIAKGLRNIPGISYQWYQNQYIKYVGNVGQDLVESIFSFGQHLQIPVTQVTQGRNMQEEAQIEEMINLGWRGWEGDLPTSVISNCNQDPNLNVKNMVYYRDTIETSVKRIPPLTCYYHDDTRPNKFAGTALTGVQPYMGNAIPKLSGKVVFTDFVRQGSRPPRGVLAYTQLGSTCVPKDYGIIETEFDFGSQPAFYVSLGTNLDQTRLFLGVYRSANVTNFNQGTVYEIIA